MTNGKSALFRLVPHPQDKLASRVPSGSLLVCLACLSKREHGVDDGPKVSRINQGANLDQFLTVGFDDKPGEARVVPFCHIGRGLWADDGD